MYIGKYVGGISLQELNQKSRSARGNERRICWVIEMCNFEAKPRYQAEHMLTQSKQGNVKLIYVAEHRDGFDGLSKIVKNLTVPTSTSFDRPYIYKFKLL
jgi:hypothetical protein